MFLVSRWLLLAFYLIDPTIDAESERYNFIGHFIGIDGRTGEEFVDTNEILLDRRSKWRNSPFCGDFNDAV